MLPLARAFFVYFFLVESYFALFCNELYQMKLNFFLLKLFEKKKKKMFRCGIRTWTISLVTTSKSYEFRQQLYISYSCSR